MCVLLSLRRESASVSGRDGVTSHTDENRSTLKGKALFPESFLAFYPRVQRTLSFIENFLLGNYRILIGSVFVFITYREIYIHSNFSFYPYVNRFKEDLKYLKFYELFKNGYAGVC